MKKSTLLLVFTLLSATTSLKATHIVGGEFSVQWRTGNTFHVTLHFYRDCGSGNAYFESPTIPVGIYDLVTNVNQQCLNIPLTDTVTLSLGDSCYNPNLCVQLGTYEQDVVIPDNPNGYYISFNNCCRNSIITNIVNPGGAGETWYAEIPDPALQNSTPVFGAYPSGYMCANNTDIQNFSCTDVDGDSLVYSLLTPLNGNTSSGNPTDVCPDAAPYPSIVWQSPYSGVNMIGGPMSIDSLTGILTADPPYLGVFVFCVRVEEFRRSDQKKLGEVRRDLQYRVLTCNAASASDTTVCAGFPVQLNATGGSVYKWSPITGLSNPNISNPIATVYTSTTYTVSISSGPCMATATITVNVHADTIVAKAGPDTTICAGQSVTLTASGGSNYLWSNSAGTTASVNVSPATTSTYTVNVSVPGCSGSTDSVKVIVLPNPAPVITQSGDTLFCSTNPAYTSYQWYRNDTLITGATDTIYVITKNATYSVKVTNSNGCSRTVSITATLVVPTPNFLVFTHACTNQCVDFINLSTNATSYKWQFPGATPATDTATNAMNICYIHPGSYIVILWAYNTGTSAYKELAYLVVTAPPPAPTVTQSSDTLFCSINAAYKSYQWYFNNTIIPGATDTSLIVSQNGNYSVQVTDSNGCSQTVVKTVGLVLPVANFTAVTQLCLNSCISFTNLSQNATSYKWKFPGAIPATDTSANPQNVCYNTAGSYNVILIAYNGAKSDTVTFTNYVTISSFPPVPLITQSNDTLFSSTDSSYSVYQWYYNDTLISGAFDSSLVITKSGKYKVQVTNINGCSDTASINATVIFPVANFTSVNHLCLNSCIDFTNLSQHATSYKWLFPGATPSTDTAANPTNICYNAAGNYDVILIAYNGVLTDTITFSNYITIYAPPPVPVITQFNDTLFSSTDTSYTGYQWYENDTLIAGAVDTSLVITKSGNYKIQVTDINGCSDTVTLNAIIIIPLSSFSSLNQLCVNDCIDFTNLSTNAISYQWFFPGGLPPSDTSANPQNICYITAGNYDVTLIATNTGGNDTLKIPGYIHVYDEPPTPVITQIGTALYCSTDTTYTAYQWYDSTSIIPGATDTFLVINHSGNYNVQVSNENSCHIAVGINVILTGIQSPFTVNGLQFTVSPNPADNWLTITANSSQLNPDKIRNLKLVIYNVMGETISYSLSLGEGRGEASIDVSSLPSGIYFIQLTSDKEGWVGRFVKE